MLLRELLLEGGKATKKLGTVRATKDDIATAIGLVARHLNLGAGTLQKRLLGSGRLTMMGVQDDSGDVDIAIHDSEVNRDLAVKQLTKATGNPPYELPDANTFCFAVPTSKDRKVQVDLMFVPDVKWALWSHHADERSKHKSGVRNELLHAALKYSMVPGEDVRVKDAEGNDIVRASRSYKLTHGVERLFKIAPKRKDGKGRVKSVVHVTPDEVRATLDELGNGAKFSPDPDVIRDPDRFAELLFGSGVKGHDMLTAEQLIELIKKHKKRDATEIFKSAVKGMKHLKFKVPDELRAYES